jgi:hypothetical protein
MKHFLAISLTAALVCAGGCTLFTPPVPQSKFSAQLGTGKVVTWSNPKNFITTNLVVSFDTNGTARVEVGFASSMNDAAIVNAGYNGQASYIDAINRLVQTSLAAGAQGAATGLMAKPPGK